MSLYHRQGAITLDTRLRVGETVKVVLLNKDRTKVYLVYELAPPEGSVDEKPEGQGLPGGRVAKEEFVRDTAYRETINEAGFVTNPKMILLAPQKRNHNLLASNPHRLIIVLSEIVAADGQEKSAPNGEYIPQEAIVEKDEVDPSRAGWFPIDNLPIQIDESDKMVRAGLYISHFLYLYEIYAEGVINVRPFCEDIMHKVVDKIAELETRREKRLTGDTADTETAPEISEDAGDQDTGWGPEAIADLEEKKSIGRETQDDEWRKWAESPVGA